MLKIKCPQCAVEGSISLLDPDYEGPYKCWKCRALFTLKLEDNKMKSCEPLSQEEYERQQAIEAMRAKMRRQ